VTSVLDTAMPEVRSEPRSRHDDAPPAGSFRPEVEGLRAIAVLAVCLYHAKVPYFGGGFVGVDIFFVISGFLITGLLIREIKTTGRVSLFKFAARRARRILPSAGIVLLAVAVAAHFMLSPLRQADVARDIIAAALYVANWHFVAQSTDYMHAGLDASPLLHFWSLGVEEQFYLVWPPILLAIIWALRIIGTSRTTALRIAGAGLLLMTVVSFLGSLHWTSTLGPLAYMGSPSRAWQFGAGGLLAFGSVALRRWSAHGLAGAVRALAGWAGLGAVVYSILEFNDATPWPGTAALWPTLGVVAIILTLTGVDPAAQGAARCGPGALLAVAPMRIVGRLSFAWYLWHWPALVFVEARYGALSWPIKALVVFASIVPAFATMRIVENPLRFAKSVRSASGGLAVGAIFTMIPLVCALGIQASAVRLSDESALDQSATAAAAAAAVEPSPADPFQGTATEGMTVPSPEQARNDIAQYDLSCLLAPIAVTSPSCMVNTTATGGHVVLIGDSHAAEWFPTVLSIAVAENLQVEILTKQGCPFSELHISNPVLGRAYTECDTWRKNIIKRLQSEAKPKMIFLGELNLYAPVAATNLAAWTSSLKPLQAMGAPIVYIKDSPWPGIDVASCVSGKLQDWSACEFQRADALPANPFAKAIAANQFPGVQLVNMEQYLCPGTGPVCPAVRGGTLLYRDNSHLTNTAATMLAPAMGAQLTAMGLIP
jgi:peptidoglycan/LPS O-acetylase OafA/YrhL